MLKGGSVFSGIGGLDRGLEQAGIEIAWQCESDPFCRAILTERWPGVRCYEDVAELGVHTEWVDLLFGGFPCQPVSTAGHRRGIADDRWLWPEFARVIRLLRPRYVLVENVPGLLVRGMGEVLGDLAALGFDAEWECVSACSVGAPHPRSRVFIVAYPNGLGRSPRVVGDDRVRKSRSVFAGRHGAHRREATGRGWPLAPAPRVRGVVDGIPEELDGPRIGRLGNSVVPQVAQWVGRQIIAYAEGEAA